MYKPNKKHMNKPGSNNSVFPKINFSQMLCNAPIYTIGVDTHDRNSLAYCLCRNVSGMTEILLVKTMRKKKQFKKEVENLSKYFNAKIYWEVN